MEYFVPFMLFLLQPAAGDGADVALVRHQALFENEEDCLAAAEELKAANLQETGTSPQAFCFAMPAPSEFQALQEAMQKRRAEARNGAN